MNFLPEGKQQLVEEVPGLCIRRLTLEDPKTARESPNSELQWPARHVCHPRVNCLPTERPSSRSWLEEIRRERQAVLTVTSLQLPECSVPLIDSQANRRCKSVVNREAVKEEALKEVFSKLAEVKVRNIKNLESKRKSVDQSSGFTYQHYENEHCCREIQSLQGSSSRAPTYGDNDDDGEEDRDADNKNPTHGQNRCKENLEEEPEVRIRAASAGCMCSHISEKLRISIRKKSEVADSLRNLSPEVTHTIRIDMKYPGRPGLVRPSENEEMASTPRTTTATATATMTPAMATATGTKSSCSGVSVAFDFTVNCSSVQLTSRNVLVRPAETVPSTPKNQGNWSL